MNAESDQFPMRLAKFMASRGVASRRKCEEIILAGRVKVNGKTVAEPSAKVAENDRCRSTAAPRWRAGRKYTSR